MAKKKMISMYIDREDLAKLKVLAEMQNMNTSELIRKLVKIYIQKATS